MTLWAIKNNNNIPATKRTGKKGDGSLCYVIFSPFLGGYYKDSFIILTGWCVLYRRAAGLFRYVELPKKNKKEKGFLSFFSPTICLFFYFLTTNLYNPTNNVSPPFFCIIYHAAPDDLYTKIHDFLFLYFSRDGDNFRRHVTDVIRIISLAL